MCPLRVLLIFLSATLAGLLVLRNLKAQPEQDQIQETEKETSPEQQLPLCKKFEWAWQQPTVSLAVRKAASTFKSLSGIANKIKIAYTMLSFPSWENLNLTVNFFSTKYMKHLGGCPRLLKQMKVNVCIMDDLPCYVEVQIVDCSNCDGDEVEHKEEKINEDVNPNSDTSANEIEGDAYSFERASLCNLSNYKGSDNFGRESHCLSESPKAGERYDRMTFSKTPSSCSEQASSGWFQESEVDSSGQPSPLPTDSLLISPVVETKKQSFCSEDR